MSSNLAKRAILRPRRACHYDNRTTPTHGRLAQPVRASALHAEGRGFEPLTAHHQTANSGEVSTMKEAFVGFDSAWAGKSPGAIAYAIFQGDAPEREELPRLVLFPHATDIINSLQKECDDVLIAIDQPTIVPNQYGSRPVDGVARALISRLRSGVQPANRNKVDMFGDPAPVWKFASDIGSSVYLGKANDGVSNPIVDFDVAKTATGQTHLIEVYPALALPALDPEFMARRYAARYNPDNKNFSLVDWQKVCKAVHQCADGGGLWQLSQWADDMAKLEAPGKCNQDKIDAAICLLIALWWRKAREEHGLTVIGDLKSGYMVTPTSDATREILQKAARKQEVPISP